LLTQHRRGLSCIVSPTVLPTEGRLARSAPGAQALTLGEPADYGEKQGGVAVTPSAESGHGRVLLSVPDIGGATLYHGGIYMSAEVEGGHERKVASFGLPGLAEMALGAASHDWQQLVPAPATLHLRLTKVRA
jgi:hypothetical protein